MAKYVSILARVLKENGSFDYYLPPIMPYLDNDPVLYEKIAEIRADLADNKRCEIITAAPTKRLGVFWLQERPGSWLAVEGKHLDGTDKAAYEEVLLGHQSRGHVFQ